MDWPCSKHGGYFVPIPWRALCGQEIFSMRIEVFSIQIENNLLENYAKLLTCLYSLTLKPFYIHSNLTLIPPTVKERVKESI